MDNQFIGLILILVGITAFASLVGQFAPHQTALSLDSTDINGTVSKLSTSNQSRLCTNENLDIVKSVNADLKKDIIALKCDQVGRLFFNQITDFKGSSHIRSVCSNLTNAKKTLDKFLFLCANETTVRIKKSPFISRKPVVSKTPISTSASTPTPTPILTSTP
ncbi:MAG: hypothetical protein HYW77_00485 [Parcubacteria group bacterium]|nr:hypothetical protein [Parcubacteria group bacterium]